MSDQADHLSNEVSLEVKIDEKGLSGKTKSRAISAIDRLVGGLLDVPAAHLEANAERARAKNAVDVAIIREEGKAAIAALYRDPEFGARLAEKFVRVETTKQINREAVAQTALENLKEISSVEDSIESIDDDWMNMFEAGAEKATSDHFRQLWGRVLAGEIRKPGSFSLSTVRFAAELDAEIARTFQSYISGRINSSQIIKPRNLAGKVLSDLAFLESCGLIQGLHGSIHLKFDRDSDNFVNILYGGWVIRIKTSKTSLSLGLIYITRIGSEIASILPNIDSFSVAIAIGEYFLEASDGVSIFSFNSKKVDLKDITLVKVLKEDN